MKLNYKRTLLLGFGFLASQLAWSLYNSFVPVMLEHRFALSTTLIGIIMTIDNMFGVIFQPLVGAYSDKTNTRFGRRMPWLMVGIPLSAIFFALIPRMFNFGLMITMLICFNLLMSLWRSPVIALMPDLTPAPLRSKANGVINFMGGIGSIIAFGAGGYLSAHVDDTNGASFLLGSGLMMFALIMLLCFIREPKSPLAPSTDEVDDDNMLGVFKAILGQKNQHLDKSEKRSLWLILLAIFFWFCAYNCIETFFTLYAVNVLGVDKGRATMMLTAFSLSFVIFAIPAGLTAGKLGRKRTILIGLVIMIGLLTPMALINSWLPLLGGISPVVPAIILLAISGAGWAMVNINSLPMVVDMADNSSIGRFTGYYYFFSFTASIFSPILFGAIRDLTQNYSLLFVYAIICYALATICILGVKNGHGEVSKTHSQSAVESA